MPQNGPLTLSARAALIEPFHVMELMKRASVLERAGRSIIHMSIGEPDFTAAPAVLAALSRAMQQGRAQYSASVGIFPLREAIAHFYKDRYGIDVSPASVVVTAGASAALLLTVAALINPGDEIQMPDPSYPCNRHFVQAFGGVPRLVPCDASERFQLSAQKVAAHWNERSRAVLIASPSNPTGTSIAYSELERIVAAVRARGGFTIVDEIYLALSYGAKPRSALELSPQGAEDLIIINSFSKYFNMTGWRLGWLVAPEHLVPIFEKLAQNLFICPSTPAQYAALACFEPDVLALYEARKAEFQRRRDYLVPALSELGFRIPVTPDGAFYVYADCSGLCADSSTLADQLLEEVGVAVVPGKDFGRNEPERWMRLSYATSMENLEEAIARMRGFLAHRKPQAA